MSRAKGFAVAPEDEADLQDLVNYFGGGNGSAYLRATVKIMRIGEARRGIARVAVPRTGAARRVRYHRRRPPRVDPQLQTRSVTVPGP